MHGQSVSAPTVLMCQSSYDIMIIWANMLRCARLFSEPTNRKSWNVLDVFPKHSVDNILYNQTKMCLPWSHHVMASHKKEYPPCLWQMRSKIRMPHMAAWGWNFVKSVSSGRIGHCYSSLHFPKAGWLRFCTQRVDCCKIGNGLSATFQLKRLRRTTPSHTWYRFRTR